MPFLQNLSTSALVWRQNTNQVAQQDANRALYRALVTYAAGKSTIGTVTYVGTGNGLIDDIDGGVDAVTETWTITFSDATNYAVSGSISGPQTAGVVGENYTTSGSTLTSLISFRIDAGGVAFVNLDAFTIPATVGVLDSPAAEQWILDRWSPFTTAGDGFAAIDDLAATGTSGPLHWHGQGNGSEAFHAGLAVVETPASQIWNFKMRVYTGFSPSSDFETNLGFSPPNYTAQWNNDMNYWFVVNSRRICAVWVVSTTMHFLYQGAILPFASPAEWPYPMGQFGEKTDEEPWNSEALTFTQGVVTPDNGFFRDTAGQWIEGRDSSAGYSNFPFGVSAGARTWWDAVENLPSGDNQLLPTTLFRPGPVSPITPLAGEAYGVMDGVWAVTGFDTSPQTLLNIGGTDYLVVNDIFRSARDDFWALELA